MYDYIKKAYGVTVKPNARVRHTVTKRSGRIARENKSAGNYIQVKFDGDKFSLPCHPLELEYLLGEE